MIKVTVIVPIYNAEKTLNRCLDSLVGQTLKEIEIITINDKSTDNTLEILKDYQKKYKNVVVIDNKENLGPAGSRNKGLQKAKGKYIGFVDSDDFVDKDMYKVMSSYMDEEVDLVTCSRFRDNGKKIKEIINIQKTTNPLDLSLVSNYTADKLFKKEIIDKNNIKFPEKYRYAEDLYFLTIYRCYSNKMKIIENPFYHICYNETSITNSYNSNILMIIDVLKDLKLFLEKNNFYSKVEDEFLKICSQYYSRRVFEFRNFTNFKLKKKFIKEFLKFFNKYFAKEKVNEYVKKYWKKKEKPDYLLKYQRLLISIYRQDKKIKKQIK